MDVNKKKYRVVKIEERLHEFIKHKAVDLHTSIQTLVEKALFDAFSAQEKPSRFVLETRIDKDKDD